jgi:hypothetical protein
MTFRALALPVLSFLAFACGGRAASVGPLPPSPCDPGAKACDAGAPQPDVATPPHDAGGGCTSTAECTGGTECVFPVDLACSAQGVCLLPSNEPCGAESPMKGCGCDGSEVDWVTGCVGLPTGYAPAPIVHLGACSDAGTGAACTTDSDCTQLQPDPPPFVCAFPIGGGCSAQGQCMPSGPLCDPSTPVACACDGTTVAYGECTGYPDGYAAKPIAYTGACQ